MGVYRWIDRLVVWGLRAGVVAVRWSLRHPFGAVAVGFVAVVVAR